MSTPYLKTLPARLVVMLGACLIALALFGNIQGTAGLALIIAGGICALIGMVWFFRIWKR